MRQLALFGRRLLALRFKNLLYGRQLCVAVYGLFNLPLDELRWGTRTMDEHGGLKDRVPIRSQADVDLRVAARHTVQGFVRATPYCVSRLIQLIWDRFVLKGDADA
jgi:hypothetical protein